MGQDYRSTRSSIVSPDTRGREERQREGGRENGASDSRRMKYLCSGVESKREAVAICQTKAEYGCSQEDYSTNAEERGH